MKCAEFQALYEILNFTIEAKPMCLLLFASQGDLAAGKHINKEI
jgi:hypothetical protein